MEAIKNKRGTTTEINLTWTIDDVLHTVKNMNEGSDKKIKLSRKQAGEVLDAVLHGHDATLGVTWETLEYYIQDVVGY